MTRGEGSNDSQQSRIVLLAAQAFALGLTMAWILIPSTAIFLARYGSGLLPVTYIGAAAVGVVSSKSLAAALRRRPLVSVAITILAGCSAVLLASWLVLWRSSAAWVSFGLLVLVPIVVPVGFMFVVGQAGMLLDVRALKALYARVVAGFALGFAAGGLAGPLLLALVGRTEHLLAAAAVAAGLFLALVALTRHSFPTQLSMVEYEDVDAEHPTLRALLRNRYVVLIVGFQMLSAVESQWLDFLVFDRAAQRYADSRELARFIGRFSAIAYGADIVFLLLLAGVLLRHFGLRYGLGANATSVLALVVSVIVAASLQGPGTTIVFVLIVAARVTDLVFSDGTSRTSLSAAYQAVPAPLRLVAPATVEGLAVPVAIGVSGVVLLGVRAAGRIDGSLLPWLTALVVAVWVFVAMLLYREYRENLLDGLRRRTLYPVELNIDVAQSLNIVDRLVESEDERDVRLGLDLLATAEHPGLAARLRRLIRDERSGVRVDALERLAPLETETAAAAARDCLDDPSADVRAACIRVLGAKADPSDLAEIVARSTDSAPEVKAAVAATLTRVGNDAHRALIANEIVRLSKSGATHDRVTAARMLGECEPRSGMDRTALHALLEDPEPAVVNAALAAICWPADAALVPAVVGRLGNRRTAGAAVDALVRGGDDVLPSVDSGLRGEDTGRRTQELLARVCRMLGGSPAVAVLRRHVRHPDREVGLAVMSALAALDPSRANRPDVLLDPQYGEPDRAESPDRAELDVVRSDLEHAAHVLRALVVFDEYPSATLLCAALRDELELLRRRILADLSVRHGNEVLSRVAFQFAQRDARSHALALEWLDVTLKGADRAVVAILEPGLADRERVAALLRRFPVEPSTTLEVLLDLVEDRDRRWRRPWLKACALYAASDVPELDLALVSTVAPNGLTSVGVDDEADIVRETLAGILGDRLDP